MWYIFVIFICALTVFSQKVINTMCGQGMQDLEYSEAGDYIHTNGCIDTVVNWIHSNMFLLGGIALGLAIPQVTRRMMATRFLQVQCRWTVTALWWALFLCCLSCSWLASSCLRYWSTRSKIRSTCRTITSSTTPTRGADRGFNTSRAFG